MEIMGGAEFLHRNTGLAFLDNVITEAIYKGLYRKWFGVLSFQLNNRYNLINGQRNNENPLFIGIVLEILRNRNGVKTSVIWGLYKKFNICRAYKSEP